MLDLRVNLKRKKNELILARRVIREFRRLGSRVWLQDWFTLIFLLRSSLRRSIQVCGNLGRCGGEASRKIIDLKKTVYFQRG